MIQGAFSQEGREALESEKRELSKEYTRKLAMVETTGPIPLAIQWGLLRMYMRTPLLWEGETVSWFTVFHLSLIEFLWCS